VDTNLDPDADCFKPPPGSILVECIHCGEEYESYLIEWRVLDTDNGRMGFWCCPIKDCDGAGFGFDIFPVDPKEGEQYGIFAVEDDDDEDYDELDEDEESLDLKRNSSDDLPPLDDDIPF
jgi:hypothetical protein